MKALVLTLPCLFLLCLALPDASLYAQYPPQAPLPGHEGIPKESPDIKGWADSCAVERGWIDIADTSLGKVSSGTVQAPLGPPSIEALSLGDGGSALLHFDRPVVNGPGPDFAVFENAFANPVNPAEAYLELAFVEVSSDGVHFARFPAVSGTQDTLQNDNFTYMDATLLHNLAGKYAVGYGTPFDLEELKHAPDLDVHNIRYIRIIDIVGSLDSAYARFDHDGRVINDPYPSPYPTGGFDLSAIAVLNTTETGIADPEEKSIFRLYPNPAHDHFQLIAGGDGRTVRYRISDVRGRTVQNGQFSDRLRVDCAKWTAGVYFIQLFSAGSSEVIKLSKH